MPAGLHAASRTATPTPTRRTATPTRTPVRTRTPTPGPTPGKIFVSGGGCTNAVTAYPIRSNGDVSPISAVTGLASPSGVTHDAAGNIYVTNQCSASITIYAPASSGNAAPLSTIIGPRTRLAPAGIAVDSKGNIYVANGATNSVTVYRPGSTGNVAPSATISGSNTKLSFPQGIAVDSSANIYVANGAGPPSGGSIAIFPNGIYGNVRPKFFISGTLTGLNGPRGIARDSKGNIYVANFFGNSITVYQAGRSGNVKPSATIGGASTGLNAPFGITLDSNGRIYVANSASNPGGTASITVYRAGAFGNVKPIAIISGASTGLDVPNFIALDSGNIDVAENMSNRISVFRAASSGNVRPIKTISNPDTGLVFPHGIAVDSSGRIYVVSGEISTVTVYAHGSNADAPPIAAIGGSNTGMTAPYGIALDTSQNLYVLNQDSNTASSITMYPAGRWGNVRPSATIKGSKTGLNLDKSAALGIAVDSSGNIYVTNCGPFARDQYVTVYMHGANGNVAPQKTIVGSNTKLSCPTAIAFDSRGAVFVTNGNNTITVYRPASNGNVAPIGTIGGLRTRLDAPSSIALDSLGRLYVTNIGSAAGFASVTVYASGSNGDAPPIAVISGPDTGLIASAFLLFGPNGIAIGP